MHQSTLTIVNAKVIQHIQLDKMRQAIVDSVCTRRPRGPVFYAIAMNMNNENRLAEGRRISVGEVGAYM